MYKCFYHNKDLDGKCSAAIVKSYYPDCHLIGIDYGDRFPWEEINNDDIIIMVDFSLRCIEDDKDDFEYMNRIRDNCKRFIWIDHHLSSIDNALRHGYKKNSKENDYFLSIDYAACELCWMFFYPDINIPESVKLLGRYDIWDHFSDEVVSFEYGMRSLYVDPESKIWKDILFSFNDVDKNKIIEKGNAVLNYLKQVNISNMEKSFSIYFEGVNFICVNNMITGSLQFEQAGLGENCDAFLVFYLNPDGTWDIRMYTPKKDIDLSIIAKKYGGGGHAGACGFKTNDISFILKKIKG